MKIQVLGSGCATCTKLYQLVQEVATEIGFNPKEVEYSTDVSRIIKLGLMTSPVLAIDNRAVFDC